MFVVKPRITAFLCFLFVAADVVIIADCFLPLAKFLILAGIVLAGGFVGWERRSLWLAFLCPFLLLVAVGWLNDNVSKERSSNICVLAESRDVFLYGTICDTKLRDDAQSIHVLFDVNHVLRPHREPLHGKVIVSIRWSNSPPDIKAGDHLFARGIVKKPVNAKFPWDYNERTYFDRVGASARLIIASPNDVTVLSSASASGQSIFLTFDKLRDRIISLHRAALGDLDGNLLSSIVIGNRKVQLSNELTVPFRNLGLSHILAASGFNLTIVVGVTWFVLRGFIRRPVVLNAAAGCTMLFYIGLAGISPSIQRAAFMCGTCLLFDSFLRKPFLPAVLGITLVLTLFFDPFAVRDVGLQLSYAATAGLIAACPAMVRLSALVRNALGHAAIEALSSLVVAQCSVLPLQLYYFWQVGLLALPANLLVAPMVPFITIEGFAVSALACMVPVDWQGFLLAIDRLTGIVIYAMMTVVHWLNSAEWAVLCTGPPPVWSITVYFFVLTMLLRARMLSARVHMTHVLCLAVSVCPMFCRGRLPPLTVVCMTEGTIIADSERNCIIIQNGVDKLRLGRAAAYLACRATYIGKSSSGRTQSFEWEPQGDALVIRWRRNGHALVIGSLPAAKPDLLVDNNHCAVFRNRIDRESRRKISNNSLVLIAVDADSDITIFKALQSPQEL